MRFLTVAALIFISCLSIWLLSDTQPKLSNSINSGLRISGSAVFSTQPDWSIFDRIVALQVAGRAKLTCDSLEDGIKLAKQFPTSPQALTSLALLNSKLSESCTLKLKTAEILDAAINASPNDPEALRRISQAAHLANEKSVFNKALVRYIELTNGLWSDNLSELLSLSKNPEDLIAVFPECVEDYATWKRGIVNLFGQSSKLLLESSQKNCLRKIQNQISSGDLKLAQKEAASLFPVALSEIRPTLDKLLAQLSESENPETAEYFTKRSKLKSLAVNFAMREGDLLPTNGSLSRWGISGVRINPLEPISIGCLVPKNLSLWSIEFSKNEEKDLLLTIPKVFVSTDNLSWSELSGIKVERGVHIFNRVINAVRLPEPIQDKYVKVLIPATTVNRSLSNERVEFIALGEN